MLTLDKQYLLDKLNENKTLEEIAKDSGCGRSTVSKNLKAYGISQRKRRPSLVGQRFGMLVVISKLAITKNKNNVWLCQCDCGKESRVLTANLTNGCSRSCGCVRRRKGSDSPCWKGCGELNGRYWSIVQANAKKRGLEFSDNLSVEYAWKLFENQNGKCALTGWPISFSNDNSQTASLDRIDSNIGYTPGNIQWVHKDVNQAKFDFSQERFLEICLAVANIANVDVKTIPFRSNPH